MSNVPSLHRREFAWQCLGGLGTASLTATVAVADSPTPPPPALPEDPPSEPKPEPQRELPSPEMLLFTLLMIQYKSELYTDGNVQAVYGDIAADLARSRQLRAFPLANGDGPADAFRVFRATAGEGAR